MLRCSLACALCLVPASAEEAAPADPVVSPRRASLAIVFENDGSFIRENVDSDRHETSSQGLIVSFHGDAADPLFDGLGLAHTGTAWGLVAGQRLFTPAVIDAPTRDPDDQPFAGFLFGGVFVQRETGNAFDHLQLDLGVVGPSALGEQTQETVHKLIGEEDPNYIDQLGDELAAQLTYRREWRVPLRDVGTWELRALPRVGFGLGTVERSVSAGIDLELGRNLGDTFSAGRLLAPASATGGPVRGWRAGVFARAGGSYVEWDTFLDGSHSRDPSASVSKQPWRGELGGGFRIHWEDGRARLGFEYLQLVLTDRFETQTTTDGVATASLTFEWSF